MKIVIKRPETPAEIEGSAFVHWQAWRETYPGMVPQRFLEERTRESCVEKAYAYAGERLIAVAEGKVVGFAACGAYRGADAEDAGEIDALYVLRAYQGCGVGRALTDACFLALAEYRRICVWVLRENEKAIGFYEHYGFRRDGAEKTIMLGGPVQGIRMVCKN